MMLYFGKKKNVYSDFIKKRTKVFQSKVLHRVFCDASQSEVWKAESSIKTPIIFLGFTAKNVTINLHFVVPMFCEAHLCCFIVTSRGTCRELLCIVSCSIYSTAVTYKPVFSLKINRN